MRRVCFGEAKRTGRMCEDSSRVIPTLAFETLLKRVSNSEGRLSKRRCFSNTRRKRSGVKISDGETLCEHARVLYGEEREIRV